MNISFSFRHIDVSESLKQYCEQQFEHVGRFLLKESHWQVVFSPGRYDFQVDVDVTGAWGHFRASAKGENFYAAVDEVSLRLGKQFQKRKEQLQYHRKSDRTREAKLRRLNAALEYDNDPYFFQKKSA